MGYIPPRNSWHPWFGWWSLTERRGPPPPHPKTKQKNKQQQTTVGILDLDDEIWQKGGDHLPPKKNNNNNSRHPWFGWWVLTKRKTPTIGILNLDNEVKGRDPKKNTTNKKTNSWHPWFGQQGLTKGREKPPPIYSRWCGWWGLTEWRDPPLHPPPPPPPLSQIDTKTKPNQPVCAEWWRSTASCTAPWTLCPSSPATPGPGPTTTWSSCGTSWRQMISRYVLSSDAPLGCGW